MKAAGFEKESHCFTAFTADDEPKNWQHVMLRPEKKGKHDVTRHL